MWDIIQGAGWPIWPLIFASIIALAIIIERLWALRAEIIAPKNLLNEVRTLIDQKGVNEKSIDLLREHSYLGEIFATALDHISSSPGLIKE